MKRGIAFLGEMCAVFLFCIAMSGDALAEFGTSVHSNRGYSVYALTFTYTEGYAFRPRVIVQYDPAFEGERISAFDLYINGELCAQLGKWSSKAVAGNAEHRAEFRLDRYTSDEFVHEMELAPVWPETADKPEEIIKLQPDWQNAYDNCSVYVQSEQDAGVPVYDSPGSDRILFTLLDGVKLTAIGPEMQGGWVAVYLETAEDELYGYVEGKHLRFDDRAIYDIVSEMQPARIASGTALYTIHNPQKKIATSDESSYVAVLGYVDHAVLVLTSSGIGVVDPSGCVLEPESGRMKCSLLHKRGFILHAEIQPNDQNTSYSLILQIDYPERYTVNDDIERFEVYVNGEKVGSADCMEPYRLYCGKLKLAEDKNTILLVPVWPKGGAIKEDAVVLPAFIK